MTIHFIAWKIKMLPKEPRWFIQRGRRGYADCDVWSFDDYLAKVISGGLREFAKYNKGHPLNFVGGESAWTAKLNEWADAIAADDDSDETTTRRTAALQELAVWFDYLWD